MSRKKVVCGAGIRAGRDVIISDVTGQVAIGDFINQFKIENPSGKSLVKLIDFLAKKRQESFNREILNKYTPSELPDYPSKLREFVTNNRVEELTKSLSYIQDHRILLISGLGGVGKTTLARALVEARPANVPLPFWFDFNINNDATLGDIIEKLAGYMNSPSIANFKVERKEAGQEDINRLIFELQKREHVWMVFDNLETVLDGTYFHDQSIDLLFTSLRGNRHKAKIIITSRTLPTLRIGENLIDAIEEEKQELIGLKENFSVDYLKKNGLRGVENEKLKELAIGVDGHPLALKLLIELVKKFGALDTLNDLSLYQKHKEDIIKKARKLFDKLAGDEKEFLEDISVFRVPESLNAITIMSAKMISKEAVRKLIDKSLLETDKNGKYWLHPLVREFAYDDLKNKMAIHKLACQYYLSLPMPEKRTKKEDVQSLIEAHYHACMAGEYDEAATIIFNFHDDLYRWGDYNIIVELLLKILSTDQIRVRPNIKNSTIYCRILIHLGNAYRNLGQAEKGIEYNQKALAISQEIEDIPSKQTALGSLGNAYNALDQTEKAIECYQKAFTISYELGDKRGQFQWLNNLGNAYTDQNQFEKAVEYYYKALAIINEIGNKLDKGRCLLNLGSIHVTLDNQEDAIDYCQEALVIAQEFGDKRLESGALINLGRAHTKLNKINIGIEVFQNALKITQEIGNKHDEGICLGNLGSNYAIQGQTEKAIEYYQKALLIAQNINDVRTEGIWLGNLGNAYATLGQTEKAVDYYNKAIALGKAPSIIIL